MDWGPDDATEEGGSGNLAAEPVQHLLVAAPIWKFQLAVWWPKLTADAGLIVDQALPRSILAWMSSWPALTWPSSSWDPMSTGSISFSLRPFSVEFKLILALALSAGLK